MPYLNQLDNDWLDGTLYPDVDPPMTLSTLSDQVDFMARLCSESVGDVESLNECK